MRRDARPCPVGVRGGEGFMYNVTNTCAHLERGGVSCTCMCFCPGESLPCATLTYVVLLTVTSMSYGGKGDDLSMCYV